MLPVLRAALNDAPSCPDRAIGRASGDGAAGCCPSTVYCLMTNVQTVSPAKGERRLARAPEQINGEVTDQHVASASAKGEGAAAGRPTKAAEVKRLLLRPEGASLNELGRATGWQPHTCRAFLTGLRKKGGVLTRTKLDDGATTYALAEQSTVGKGLSQSGEASA